MSILSSITTFSILGFMAKKLGKTIDNVANDGKTLMFVIYPEIASLSPMPMLFSLMFFIMILFLGIICIVWFISTITTSFLERFSKLKSLKNIVLCISTGFLYIVGIPVTTKAGIYYFEILNTFALSFNLIVIGGIECIGIMYFYGIRNFNSDINVMFEKNRNLFLKIFGSFKYLMSFFHMFINPLVLLGLTIIGIKEMLEKSYNYNDKQYHIILPTELICFGWFLCLLPLFLIVLGLLLEIWKKRDMSIMEIIKPNEKHITTLEQYKQSYLITFLDSFSRCWRRKKSIVRISVFSEDLVFSK
uniref:Sodium-dependent dopamine transporter (inferred by orthology to a human protein) n=1 Tax=Strongyloides venezuelensis TaxID=75913 RepID=A0A0K0FB45_STRVS